MTLSPRTVWVLALLVSMPALVVTGWKYRGASSAEAASAKKLQRVTAQAEEIRQLRVSMPTWANSPTPGAESKEPLAQRVPAAIAAAGLPATALSSLSPESNSGDGGASGGKTGVRIDRRRATLTFGALTLPQLGRFLAAWREREPGWVVTSIDATPERSGADRGGADRGGHGGQAQAGGDLPVRVVLAVENVSVHRPKVVSDPSSRPSLLPPASKTSSSSRGASR